MSEIDIPNIPRRPDTDMALDPEDGAILFRKTGIEILVPDLPPNAMLPEHLSLMMAIASRLADPNWIKANLDAFHDRIEALKKANNG